MQPELQFLDLDDAHGSRRIACRIREGTGTPVVWFGGFRSDMTSTKAASLDEWCAAHGRPMIRFDYSGHGESSGAFADGVFSEWAADAEAVLARFVSEPALIVGSSMGGWIATWFAKRHLMEGQERNPKVAGLLLIAPACDFTEELMWPQFPEEVRREIMEQGQFLLPSAYSDDPTPITQRLMEDGRRMRVLGESFRVGCPVHILQGMQDPDVPFQHALRLVEHLPLDPVVMTLINDGDHRLSRDQDIARLLKTVAEWPVAA